MIRGAGKEGSFVRKEEAPSAIEKENHRERSVSGNGFCADSLWRVSRGRSGSHDGGNPECG